MNKTPEQIAYMIRGAIMEVYFELGPGLLESVYEKALYAELKDMGLHVETQVEVPVAYKGKRLDADLRLDLIVEDTVIVELKSVLEMKRVFYMQLRTYLKLMNKPLGILVNFNTSYINGSIHNVEI